MPNLDGLSLVKKIRESYAGTAVILMTAHGSEEIAIQAIQAGAASYVPKKSLARELASTLEQILVVADNERRQHRLLSSMEARDARFCLENDKSLLGPLISLIQNDLKAMDVFDATARIRIGVALQEALSNALFHGNLEVSSDLRQDDERRFYSLAEARRAHLPYRDRRIRVKSIVGRSEAECSAIFVIEDEGPGFDTSRIDRPVDPEDLMRIGGRGLFLIRAFMDEVTFNTSGNRIVMIKRDRPGSRDPKPA